MSLRLYSGGKAAYPPNTQPPLFESRTVTGQRVSLAALKGSVVLLTFWARGSFFGEKLFNSKP
jgi:hypothetical protein